MSNIDVRVGCINIAHFSVLVSPIRYVIRGSFARALGLASSR